MKLKPKIILQEIMKGKEIKMQIGVKEEKEVVTEKEVEKKIEKEKKIGNEKEEITNGKMKKRKKGKN